MPAPMDMSQARSLGVCKWCQEPDHTSADCAIAQLHQLWQKHRSVNIRAHKGQLCKGPVSHGTMSIQENLIVEAQK